MVDVSDELDVMALLTAHMRSAESAMPYPVTHSNSYYRGALEDADARSRIQEHAESHGFSVEFGQHFGWDYLRLAKVGKGNHVDST